MISPVKLWRNQKNVRDLSGKEGTILSWSIIRVPPEGFGDQAPYALVLVKIDETHEIGQLVDCDLTKIAIGQKVKAVVRRVRRPDSDGIIPYGIKFVLLEEGGKG